ncbi:hypothetical protein, partial [Alistipes communis]|uniref:hypothetical protein n=1 Tax=Alistipes communis TaxID=2585118 RepID=UPI0019393EE9
ALRKRVRSAGDTGDKGRLFSDVPMPSYFRAKQQPEKSVSRHTRTVLLPKDGICRCRNFRRINVQRHGEKRKKTIRTLVFSHETPYLYPQG